MHPLKVARKSLHFDAPHLRVTTRVRCSQRRTDPFREKYQQSQRQIRMIGKVEVRHRSTSPRVDMASLLHPWNWDVDGTRRCRSSARRRKQNVFVEAEGEGSFLPFPGP